MQFINDDSTMTDDNEKQQEKMKLVNQKTFLEVRKSIDEEQEEKRNIKK